MPIKIDSLRPSLAATPTAATKSSAPSRSGDGVPASGRLLDVFVRGPTRRHSIGRTGATLPPLPAPLAQHVRDRIAELVATACVARFDAAGTLAATRDRAPVVTDAMRATFEAELPDLARDPARGSHIGANTLEEAAVGFLARLYGVVVGSMRRDDSGIAEFVDRRDYSWDVKSPLSPPAGATWKFDAAHVLTKVEHDLRQGDRVILNLTKCTPDDTAAAVATLRAGLTVEERALVVVLLHRADLHD